MLSSVLRSARSVPVNIAIMRVFVDLRQLAETHKDLAAKITAMEKRKTRFSCSQILGNRVKL